MDQADPAKSPQHDSGRGPTLGSATAKTPLRVGVVFGGASREREVSFAGGRTVFDNLDRRFFQPIPLFIDSYNQLVRLDWRLLYRGAIRDFYPPAHLQQTGHWAQPYAEHLFAPDSPEHQQALAAIGAPLPWADLPKEIDLAFLVLHGRLGEDGTLQGMLEWLGVPYTGTGLLGAALGMDKLRQRPLLERMGYPTPDWLRLPAWTPQATQAERDRWIQELTDRVGWPLVLKHPTQGSSIGVKVVQTPEEFLAAWRAVSFCFELYPVEWLDAEPTVLRRGLQRLAELREGPGFPLAGSSDGETWVDLPNPEALLAWLRSLPSKTSPVWLKALDAPIELLAEGFVEGQEFSVIVLRDQQQRPLALPPTGIYKAGQVYRYEQKYLPGQAHKETPLKLPLKELQTLGRQAERLMDDLNLEVYARLDGIRSPSGRVFFNDPNTTSGMLPSSFFFHQAAEAGLIPRDLLTLIVERSLDTARRQANLRSRGAQLYNRLAQLRRNAQQEPGQPLRVAVLMGGYSTERHISLESGRNVTEKLASLPECQPQPYFLLDNTRLSPMQREILKLPESPGFSLWSLPPALLLKDNADDVAASIVDHFEQPKKHPYVQALEKQSGACLAGFAENRQAQFPRYVAWADLPSHADAVFIALHGRPGEDGQVQQLLLDLGLPFNGSLPEAAALAMDKAAANAALEQAGLRTPSRLVVQREDFLTHPDEQLKQAGNLLRYPLVAKPVDEGCSSAVLRLQGPAELRTYLEGAFRSETELPSGPRTILSIAPTDPFPRMQRVLLEEWMGPRPDHTLLEVTVGFHTQPLPQGGWQVSVLEPSEAASKGEVLSLAEKFLAGEGLNITPARFSNDPHRQAEVSAHVKQQVQRAAKVLGLSGYARIDAFVYLPNSGPPEVVFIEANTLPGLTPATCLFHQAALADYTPARFLESLLQFGIHRQRDR